MKKISYNEYLASDIKPNLNITTNAKANAIADVQRANVNISDWIAFPIIEELNDKENIALASYCVSEGIKNIYGYSLRSAKRNDEVFKGNPTPEEFRLIAGSCLNGVYVIIPEPENFEIISDGDLYSIFIGPQDFISSIVNYDLDESTKRFNRFAITYKNKAAPVYDMLINTINTCNEFNSKK